MVKSVAFKIIWDIEAFKQFKEILSYLKDQSNDAPKIVKNEILERAKLIKLNPSIFEIDKLKEIPSEDFRAFVVFSYRVTYQIKSEEREIRILRIRHTSREPLEY